MSRESMDPIARLRLSASEGNVVASGIVRECCDAIEARIARLRALYRMSACMIEDLTVDRKFVNDETRFRWLIAFDACDAHGDLAEGTDR